MSTLLLLVAPPRGTARRSVPTVPSVGEVGPRDRHGGRDLAVMPCHARSVTNERRSPVSLRYVNDGAHSETGIDGGNSPGQKSSRHPPERYGAGSCQRAKR